MANTIRDYSATPANNTVVDGADISEGCSPAGINDAIRGVMADLKDVSTGAVALESPAADSLTVTGNVGAATFSGDGSALTGIPTPTLTSLGIANHDDITVDASGNVGIGTTTNNQSSSTASVTLNAASGMSAYELRNADVFSGYVGHTGTNMYLVNANNGSLGLYTNNAERMRIDSSGRVTMPYQPSFRSRGSNGAYIQTSPIPFPTVLHNIGSHYNSSTYTFTAPIAGRYLFHVHIGITNGSTNLHVYPTLSVNGVGQQYSYFQIASTWYGNNHLTAILDLSVNDYVNVTFSGNGSYYNGGSECQFSGHLLG